MGKREDLAGEAKTRRAAKEERHRRICELRDKGTPIPQIAKSLGVGLSTVKRALILEQARKVAAGK